MKKLEFSPPTTRYESTAIDETSQGQNFLIKVSSSEKSEVEKIINNLKITLDNQNNQSVDDLNIIVELADINELEKIQNLKFKFGNDSIDRGVENEGLKIITRQPKQSPTIKNAFYIGPLLTVKANIKLTAGEAAFSVWQADKKEGPWSKIPGAEETLSRDSGNINTTLPPSSFIANSPKYFLLKVDGRTGSVYTITGDWYIP
ncbi:hypothetical protein [Nostoc sp.]|uniref:hypothetical protein n=1 Tax=Nostoc sp. TaxID=1180 RepID=UPI002FF2716C